MNISVHTHNIENVAAELTSRSIKKIIRLKRVLELTGLSRSTIYDRINPKSKRYDASFPKSVRLGSPLTAGAVGWIESEIQYWIEQRIQDSQH